MDSVKENIKEFVHMYGFQNEQINKSFKKHLVRLIKDTSKIAFHSNMDIWIEFESWWNHIMDEKKRICK